MREVELGSYPGPRSFAHTGPAVRAPKSRPSQYGAHDTRRLNFGARLVLSCGIPLRILSPHIRRAGGGQVFDVGNSHVHVAEARIIRTGSSLTYDSSLCQRGPAPR